MAGPLLLLLPVWAAAAVWAAVILAAFTTPLLFARQEKRDLAYVISRVVRRVLRKRP